ncbi:hypothetical protein EV174_002902 [Coemansia sp. RSA 2320]|nr:hypothetical protein EV174_002902 [Coemansia sp. RSA 2320]
MTFCRFGLHQPALLPPLVQVLPLVQSKLFCCHSSAASPRNNGFGVGASATVGLFGKVLPTVSVGGGAAAGVGNNLAVAALSATVSEGGGLNGLVAPANAGVSVNGEVGLQFSNGVHGLVGGNGGVWGTAGYGGFFIPSSTAMANFGGNFEFLFNNQGAAAPTPST